MSYEQRTYTFLKKYSLNDIFDNLSAIDTISCKASKRTKENEFQEYNNEKISMISQRYKVFKEKGCDCIVCGRKGTHFRMQRNLITKKGRYHFGLWSDDSVQMTKDHIIPKSIGGTDRLENYQTMCEVCNKAKDNQFTYNDILNGETFCFDYTLKIFEFGVMDSNWIKNELDEDAILSYKSSITILNGYKLSNEKIWKDNKLFKEEKTKMLRYFNDILEISQGSVGINAKFIRSIPMDIRKNEIIKWFKGNR